MQSFERRAKKMLESKRGQTGVVTGLVGAIFGLVLLIIVMLIFVNQISTANLLPTGVEATAVTNLRGNVSAGVESLNSKIPIFFTIAILVAIIGILVIAVVVAKRFSQSGGGGSQL